MADVESGQKTQDGLPSGVEEVTDAPEEAAEYEEEEEAGPEVRMEFGKAAKISRTEAREALLDYVSQHCCYGKGAAQKMQIKRITPSNAMHYTLETFCEGRATSLDSRPYGGGAVDGPQNGRAPEPWDIHCTPEEKFVNESRRLRVPHTSQVKTCPQCHGRGEITCGHCQGSGRDKCYNCGGNGENVETIDGQQTTRRCSTCNGSGERRCSNCSGTGKVTCHQCNGYGKLEVYEQLEVYYKNHVTDYILEGSGMPSSLIRTVEGVEIFQQTQRQVWPITAFPVIAVNQNSIRLVEEARRGHPKERQLQQKQILRAVPVTQVDYQYGNFSSKFWVYGIQRKVHSPDYPEKFLWGCNIL